jgi:hypothetical protein
MRIVRVLSTTALAGGILALAACSWTAKVTKKVGQPAEGEISASGTFPAPALASQMRAVSAITASDLYIDTSGTDFALSNSGNVALTLTNSNGTVVAASVFPWIKSGVNLVFQNPAAVQSWLNQYPTAASVDAKLAYGNTPADGADHVMTTAIVYQGSVQASATSTFAAECMTRYNTRELCRQ